MRDGGVLEAGVPLEAGAPDAGLGASVAEPDEPEDDADESELPPDRRPDIALRLSPESGAMTGDVVTAIVTVTLTDGDDVAVPRQRFGDLELHDQRRSERLLDARREFTFELDFLMLEPGEHELPPIRLRVVLSDGVVGIVQTEATTITVGSLTANEPDALPRPPTPADIVVMQDDYTLAWVLGIAAAMLLSALLGWLLARWWKARPREVPPPPPPRPPWEVALEKLAALRTELGTTTRDADAVAIVDRASDALREYLGGRYDFQGLESTTDEVVARMKNARLQSISLNEIIALLGDADLVKFAKALPDQAQCERMIEGAERIVKGTIPMASAISRPAPPARSSKPAGAFEPGSADPRSAWNADIEVKPRRSGPGAVLEAAPSEAPGAAESAEAPLPATNPPPPPVGAAAPASDAPPPAVSHDTLRDGTIEGVPAILSPPGAASAPPASAPVTESTEPSRPTPVGFSDPTEEGPKP